MKYAELLGHKVGKPLPGGRRLVLTDIHGCDRTFEKLLEKVAFTNKDQLFLLGDFINRGPRSKQVLDRVLGLIEKNYNVFPLMGNHEETVLHIIEERPDELNMLLRSRNSMNLLNKHDNLRKRFFRFFRKLPYFYELDNCYLVHAGFNMKIAHPLSDGHAMTWTRNFSLKKKFNGRMVIHGHVPTRISRIRKAIDRGSRSICLDSGCSHTYLGKEYGMLLCFDIDSRELVKQKNID